LADVGVGDVGVLTLGIEHFVPRKHLSQQRQEAEEEMRMSERTDGVRRKWDREMRLDETD
jgi:hypothetical protein